jgi:hypothetical protein
VVALLVEKMTTGHWFKGLNLVSSFSGDNWTETNVEL